MNGLAWIVAAAVLSGEPDVGWEPLAGGGFEFIIQLDDETIAAMKQGEPIRAAIPANLRGVRQYRIVYGRDRLPRIGTPPQVDDQAALDDRTGAAASADRNRWADDEDLPVGDATTRATDETRSGFDSLREGWPGADAEKGTGARSTAAGSRWADDENVDTRTTSENPLRGGAWTRPGETRTASPGSEPGPSSPFGRGALDRPGKQPVPSGPRGESSSGQAHAHPDGSASAQPPGESTPRPFLSSDSAHRLASYRGEDDKEGSAGHDHAKGSTSKSKSSSTSETMATAEPEKSWWALSFTAILLFASLGGNAYLGWTVFGMRQQFGELIERLKTRRRAHRS
jgi:cytoskeletal protein RodZ